MNIKPVLRAIYESLFRSRYVMFLESENQRLLDENRSLVNSLLTHAGMPQIGPRPSKPSHAIQGKLMPSQWRRAAESQDRKIMEEIHARQNLD